MAMKLLEFMAWEPDQPDYGGAQATDAKNVIPVKRGYRPLPGPVESALPALDSQIFGAFSCMDSSGTVISLAATSNAIYKASFATWTSNAGGFGATSPWQFTQYGDTIIATNLTDGPQYATAGLGLLSAFAPISGASNASFVAVVKDFVMFGDIVGHRNAVRWSGINEPLSYPALGSTEAQNKQSDIQVFPAGGNVQCVLGGLASVDGLVFLEHSVYRALYVGPPLIFQFDIIDRQQGTPAPYSVVKAGGAALYFGEEGWKKTDGVNSVSIGADRVDRWFKDTCDPMRYLDVRGVADPINSVAMWIFPSTAAPAKQCDMVLVYNYVLDRWSYGTIATEFILPLYSATATLESLDAYGSIDSLPFSLDSKAFMGGVLAAGLFTPAHKLATLDGTPLAASMTTGEMGGSRMMVTGIRPLVDRATPECAIVTRELQGSAPVETACAAVSSFDGIAYCHQSTRYVRAKVDIAAGAVWTHCPAVELHYEDEGAL